MATYSGEKKYTENYFKYQSERSFVIKFLRKHTFIANLIKKIKGKCVDFGCGSGEQLEQMPKGSIGLDINPFAIEFCISKGLNAVLYDSEADSYELKQIKPNIFSTLVMSHLLEHFDNSKEVFIKLLNSCVNKGIDNIVIVVPGVKGYASDLTHVNYINLDFFNKIDKVDLNGFEIIHKSYYPINSEFFSKFFRYNELLVVLKRKNIL